VVLAPGAGRFANRPLQITLSVRHGYDDNIFSSPKNPVPAPTPVVVAAAPTPAPSATPTPSPTLIVGPPPRSSPTPEPVEVPTPTPFPEQGGKLGSMYTQTVLGVNWALARARTLLTLSLRGGATYYWDRPDDKDDLIGDIDFLMTHRLTARARVNAGFNVSYRSQPEIGRRFSPVSGGQGDYVALNGRLALENQWTGRIKTNSSYTASGTLYQEERSKPSNVIENVIGSDIRYQFSPRFSVLADYRYSWVNRETETLNTTSHILLAGVNFQAGARTDFDLRVGQEYKTFEVNDESRSVPYGELGVIYHYGKGSTLRLSSRFGSDYDDSPDIERSNITTRLSIDHVITARLSATLAGVWERLTSQYEDGREEEKEDRYTLDMGLEYVISPDFTVDLTYTYYDIFATDPTQEYRRNRISLGGTYTF
jgi:opacity protein-like surface antigen